MEVCVDCASEYLKGKARVLFVNDTNKWLDIKDGTKVGLKQNFVGHHTTNTPYRLSQKKHTKNKNIEWTILEEIVVLKCSLE